MALPKSTREVETAWGRDNSNLECELLLFDFFRQEEGYSADRPLVLCRDGGLMCLHTMDGLDPETMGEDGLAGASAAIRRAIDVLNPMNQDGEWRHGVWEVQNIWTRSLGSAPVLAQPTRDSAALRYLVNASNVYWQGRVVFEDSILWVFKFLPRFRERNPLAWRVWKLRDSSDEAVFKLKLLREQARMFRRTLRVVEENLMAFAVRRPKMGFGFRPLSETECCLSAHPVLPALRQARQQARAGEEADIRRQQRPHRQRTMEREYTQDGEPMKGWRGGRRQAVGPRGARRW
jgi:hypothetical protein